LDLSSVPVRQLEVRTRKYRGRLFIARYDHVFELNGTAEFLFKQIDGISTVRQIAQRIVDRYRIGLSEAVAETREFMAPLVAAQIIQLRSGTGGPGAIPGGRPSPHDGRHGKGAGGPVTPDDREAFPA
jgi:pyrroloquinoline quinone biosynthesis protein D